MQYLHIKGDNHGKLNALSEIIGESQIGEEGIAELEFVLNHPATIQHASLTLDLTLARGLNYYTGTIFEVNANKVQIGSIGGGGRYDDLTGLFGVPGIPGVGISFGVDRIYDVLEELQLFPEAVLTSTQVLFFNLGEKESQSAFELVQLLRTKSVSCEIYPENSKFDKQFKYAEKKNIPFVAIIGSKEMEEKTVRVKNLRTGEERILNRDETVFFQF